MKETNNVMLSIFILNWNSVRDVSNLLRSLVKSDYRKFRVLLIHNATKDLDYLRKLYNEYQEKLEVHLIINDENYGYAGGNNSGFEYLQKKNIQGDILILNPDVTVQPDTLTALVNAKEKTNAGAVMIRTYDDSGVHLYDRVKLNGFNQSYHFTDKETYESDYAAGSCLLLDRTIINEIGLFDEKYFMYWEEVDLSLRIKQLDKLIIGTTTSFITRKANPVERSANAIYYSVRNSFYLKEKFTFDIHKHNLYLLKMLLGSIKASILCLDLQFFLCFLQGFKNRNNYYGYKK